MTAAVKGDRNWDKQFQAKITDLDEDFWEHWLQMDYVTVQHAVITLTGMLPKLVELAHTRGKQGHGKK